MWTISYVCTARRKGLTAWESLASDSHTSLSFRVCRVTFKIVSLLSWCHIAPSIHKVRTLSQIYSTQMPSILCACQMLKWMVREWVTKFFRIFMILPCRCAMMHSSCSNVVEVDPLQHLSYWRITIFHHGSITDSYVSVWFQDQNNLKRCVLHGTSWWGICKACPWCSYIWLSSCLSGVGDQWYDINQEVPWNQRSFPVTPVVSKLSATLHCSDPLIMLL